MNVGSLSQAEVACRCAGPGLFIQTGPFVTRVRMRVRAITEGLSLLYGDHPLADGAMADFHTRFVLPRTHRRWIRPKLHFFLDRQEPFMPLPAAHALPLFEWALNWCVWSRMHHLLIVHAAVIERGGRCAIMPAPPGSGKSTLCAALVHRGWRLLSDELALIEPNTLCVLPLVRPVSLKNESIDVIRSFAPQAVLSEPVTGTNKGAVAHMKPPTDSVRRAGETARPAWIVLPRYRAGAPATITDRAKGQTFLSISDHAFNYSTLGSLGFETMAKVMDACSCHDVEYGDLEEAVELFENLATAAL